MLIHVEDMLTELLKSSDKLDSLWIKDDAGNQTT